MTRKVPCYFQPAAECTISGVGGHKNLGHSLNPQRHGARYCEEHRRRGVRSRHGLTKLKSPVRGVQDLTSYWYSWPYWYSVKVLTHTVGLCQIATASLDGRTVWRNARHYRPHLQVVFNGRIAKRHLGSVRREDRSGAMVDACPYFLRMQKLAPWRDTGQLAARRPRTGRRHRNVQPAAETCVAFFTRCASDGSSAPNGSGANSMLEAIVGEFVPK